MVKKGNTSSLFDSSKPFNLCSVRCRNGYHQSKHNGIFPVSYELIMAVPVVKVCLQMTTSLVDVCCRSPRCCRWRAPVVCVSVDCWTSYCWTGDGAPGVGSRK